MARVKATNQLTSEEMAAIKREEQEAKTNPVDSDTKLKRQEAREKAEQLRLTREARQAARRAEKQEAEAVLAAEDVADPDTDGDFQVDDDESEDVVVAPYARRVNAGSISVAVHFLNGDVAFRTYTRNRDASSLLYLLQKTVRSGVAPLFEDDDGTVWLINNLSHIEIRGSSATVLREGAQRPGSLVAV